VKQGEVLTVQMHRVADAHHVTLAGRKARLFPQPDGTLLALPSVSVFQKPGNYPLTIFSSNGQVLKTIPITIQDGHYRTQNVSVSKSTAGLQPLPGEMEAIQALKERISSTKHWEEPFVTPTSDCQNSPFGVKRLHNGVPTGDYHKGVDLRSPAGRPIKATNSGVVEIARMYRLHGGTVGLDHGQGVSSIYIHMSKLAVKPGDKVKKGDIIGYVGSTGFASGPHLHWGMYMSGLPVNPNQWIANVPKCR
jgi:murein DD-endopeptidase MepM/ murein hydrolase activator NlpD